jgi:glycosyltransferase involved in cell wall biosynthesis
MNTSTINNQDKSLPLVSIGIPTYNRAETLIKTIESILMQNYQNLEMIISDNASTDRTEEVCLNYVKQDNRIRYIRQSVNQGAIFNFKNVWQKSRGEFFMWLADDDWLGQKQYISECVNKLLTNPDFSLVCGKIFYFKDEKYLFQEKEVRLLQETGLQRAIAYYKCPAPNGIFYGLRRRHSILDLTIKDVNGWDWLISGQVAFSGKVDIINTITLNRSWEGTSGNGSIEKTIEALKLPENELENIYLKLGNRAFLDVLSWDSSLFRYGIFSQLYLACRVFFLAWLFSPHLILKARINKFLTKSKLTFVLKTINNDQEN